MSLSHVVLTLAATFLAFVLEHLPMPELLSWLEPNWVSLLVMVLVIFQPRIFGLWLAWPLGLMLDTEQGAPFGLNVCVLLVQIFALQLMHRRVVLFHFVQQMAVVFLLIALGQVVYYWAMVLMTGDGKPVLLWQPALVSAALWPWVYGLTHLLLIRMRSQ
ncbi:rod shape-determining protein MreD [Bacterioplanes sanyensis]|uniref:Rod shape-determining protein MreD n=1 Tax=Bacterioplanes sanyensis TaxID=1249553 RepID=A0A222FJB0_9GAMM|nr:rod shape-determining protein MreD [Bacterioplanes sanyensis]ASP38732.1 rod shape-determining protein MreD [Bacterioplanes sanyensis]